MINLKFAAPTSTGAEDIKVIVFTQGAAGVFTAMHSQSVVGAVAENTTVEFALNPPLPIGAGEFIGVFFPTGRVARDASGPNGFFVLGDQSAAVSLQFAATSNGQVQIGGNIVAP